MRVLGVELVFRVFVMTFSLTDVDVEECPSQRIVTRYTRERERERERDYVSVLIRSTLCDCVTV